MNKYKDFSLHFTTKDQSLEELKQKYYDFDAKTLEDNEVLVSELLGDEEDLVLHHCFLTEHSLSEKRYPLVVLETLEFLDTVCEEAVTWYQTPENLQYRRYAMLRNLKRIGGVAIFLGEIKESVEGEYKLAQKLGLPCIHIK